jgi:hypothetical protein
MPLVLEKPLPHPVVVGELALWRGGELGEEVGGAEVGVVEVDGGDDGEVRVLRRGHTEAAMVGAGIGA